MRGPCPRTYYPGREIIGSQIVGQFRDERHVKVIRSHGPGPEAKSRSTIGGMDPYRCPCPDLDSGALAPAPELRNSRVDAADAFESMCKVGSRIEALLMLSRPHQKHRGTRPGSWYAARLTKLRACQTACDCCWLHAGCCSE